MEYQPNEPLNIQLSQLVDEYLGILLHRDETPESYIREASFHREYRLVAVVTEFKETVERIREKRQFSTNDYAILATFYRDVRVFAATRGLLDLFRIAFMHESRAKRRMYRTSARRRDHAVACLYLLWGITSRYGTSLVHWIMCGAALIVAFSFLISAHLSLANSWLESVLLSVETFTQCSYDVSGRQFSIRVILLAERLLGMAYFVFGFSLLLPRLSMELSRTTLTINRKHTNGGERHTIIKMNDQSVPTLGASIHAIESGEIQSNANSAT